MGCIHRPHYTTVSAWKHDEEAYRALVFGAADLEADPLPEEPVCGLCDGEGTVLDQPTPWSPERHVVCPDCLGRDAKGMF